jgi:hypothetical protein
MFAPYRFESGALRRKTSAGFASGQRFFLGIHSRDDRTDVRSRILQFSAHRTRHPQKRFPTKPGVSRGRISGLLEDCNFQF